jgi:hypothetical protein
MLAGCGGSQTPIGAPGETPQTSAIAAHADRGKSWMLPEAKSQDLLYVGDTETYVYVLSYSRAKYLGRIALPVDTYIEGAFCSDLRGNVYIPTYAEGNYTSYVYEYAHGATSPKQTLEIDGFTALSCSVDPRSGDLAIGGWTGKPPSPASELAVYRKAKGEPKFYTDGVFKTFTSCSYDDRGNVFAFGIGPRQLAELPKGNSTFRDVSVEPKSQGGPVQWDGRHVTITTGGIQHRHFFQRYHILQLQISGSIATVVGKTGLITRKHLHQTWIQGSTVIATPYDAIDKATVLMWQYPAGGKQIRAKPVPARYTYALTVSILPSDLRSRR